MINPIMDSQIEWLNGNKGAQVIEHPEVLEIIGGYKMVDLKSYEKVSCSAANWVDGVIVVHFDDEKKEFYIENEDGSLSGRYYFDGQVIDKQTMDDGSAFRYESWQLRGDEWDPDYSLGTVHRLDWDQFGKDPWMASDGPELDFYREDDNMYVAAAQYIKNKV